MNLTFTATLLIVLSIWSRPCLVSADNTAFRANLSIACNQMVERINVAHAAHDTVKMENLADEIQDKWSKTDIQYYGVLIDKVCYAILIPNMSQQNPRAAITEKYALLALKRRDELSVAMEANFVSYLLPQEGNFLLKRTLKGQDWVSYRSVKAAITLHTLGRIEKEMDRNFNFSKIPLLQVAPPLAAAVDSGTSPESVSDPKLRAEYEASIKANDAINDKYREQSELKSLQATFVPQEENYVIALYSIQPYNQSQLKHLLDTYLTDNAVKQKILDQVTNNIRSAK